MTTPLETARSFLARGLSVIPIPRPRAGVPPGQPGDGKVPAIPWREYQTRLPTDAELVAWFAGEPMNIAIVTGAVSGVVVVDADDPIALAWCTHHLPYTVWQTKTSRGYHLWYRHPGVRVPNRAALAIGVARFKIDVRGDGGFVIAAGSVHASGVEYAEGGDWTQPRASVPVFWPGWLERPTRGTPPRRPPVRPAGDIVERARRYLSVMPRPEIGFGSDRATLYAACRLVRGFGLSAADSEQLLWEWAGGRPGWSRAWIAAKVAHAERYGTEPIGALK